jgi:multiple sugar transport system ATP-binding protein
MRAELVKLHRRLGVTTLYVTHDQTEAMTLGERVAVIRDGAIQQVDAPQRLYHRPSNTFVASFIGSPPMNFAEAMLDGGSLALGPYRLELPEAIRARARTDRGTVLCGLRPEAFQDARFADQGRPTIPAEVEITEQLGPEVFAYFRVPELEAAEIGERPLELAGAFAARLDPRSAAAPGRSLPVAVDLDGVQLFDSASGDSLLAD